MATTPQPNNWHGRIFRSGLLRLAPPSYVLGQLPALVRITAVCFVEMRNLLIQCAVVVDDQHDVDPVARCGFKFCQMIIDGAIPREADYGRIR